MQKFRLDWNYHSNKIEGNSYTYGETKMLILYGLTAGGKPIKDYKEISGHNEAIEYIIDVIKDGSALTETFIRQLHKLILEKSYYTDAKTIDGQPTQKLVKVGEYKTESNHVETVTGELFYFAEPFETPVKMQELVDWYRNKKDDPETNPLILAAEFHYRFIRIHPFDDGNGRMARLLMNFILMQNGFPPVIVKTEDKENYIAVLRQADLGVLEPFIQYVGESLIHSLEIMIKGARGESIEESDDFDKELALLKQKVKNVGVTMDVTKNKEVLINIFENSIEPLIHRFVEVCKKFDDFYLKSGFLLFWDSGANTSTIEQIIANAKSKILDRGDAIEASLQYNFTNFRQTGFQDFNFSSQINIKFDLARYKLSLNLESSDQFYKEYERLYSEQLTSEEIDVLVKMIGAKHKKFIESKVEDKINNDKGVDDLWGWLGEDQSIS
jgi:Fic family protein